MTVLFKPPGYYEGCNAELLRAVPAGPLRLLDAGCGSGALGVALKAHDPRRTVIGAERHPDAAAQAAERLDRVFTADLDRDDLPLADASLDGLLFGDALEHLADPLAALRRLRRLLAPGGFVLASLPNAQHHARLAALLKADLQDRPAGRPDDTHLRLFTYATALKLLLDAGFAPQIITETRAPAPDAFLAAAEPLLRHLGLHPGRTHRYLDATHYVLRGDLLPDAAQAEADDEAAEPLTFAVCVSDPATLAANLLASPCLRPGTRHQVIALDGCQSAADGLNAALQQAKNRLVVCVHQDVYLPAGWVGRFLSGWAAAEASGLRVGVAGVYGTALADSGEVMRAGRVVDRDRLRHEPAPLPAAVEALDELLLAVPRDTPLRFDPALGFHLYGADLCLQARRLGLAALALDAICFHHSKGVGLPPAFAASARVFARKWAHRLPVATPCATIDHSWLGA